MSRILEVRTLGLVRGTRRILAGVTFEACRGELVALIGASGSGKSTILRSIVGLERFDSGEIDVDGVLLMPGVKHSSELLTGLRRKIGMVFQFHALFEHLSVIENVSLAPIHVQGLPRDEALARARTLLASLGVGTREHALPRELSGGEAQRVAIARSLAIDPPLLLLDEPTASLDPARRNELGAHLRDLAAAGRSLVFTSHDVSFVRDYATRVVVLSEGRVTHSGDPGTMLTGPSGQLSFNGSIG
jgi:ABC-type polar amino acid transport system ATPase subunit